MGVFGDGGDGRRVGFDGRDWVETGSDGHSDEVGQREEGEEGREFRGKVDEGKWVDMGMPG